MWCRSACTRITTVQRIQHKTKAKTNTRLELLGQGEEGGGGGERRAALDGVLNVDEEVDGRGEHGQLRQALVAVVFRGWVFVARGERCCLCARPTRVGRHMGRRQTKPYHTTAVAYRSTWSSSMAFCSISSMLRRSSSTYGPMKGSNTPETIPRIGSTSAAEGAIYGFVCFDRVL